jgi:hypothetical protein
MYQDSVSSGPVNEPGSAAQESPGGPMTETAEVTEAAAEIDAERDHVHPFREELARAMQAAAERERQRIAASVDEDATTHVQKVRTRAAAEAGELKRLAEDDVTGIRGWAKSEIERIRGEADAQMTERRDRLEQHLVQHAAIIDGEIDRVSEAVEGYRHELDAFFARMAAERDPAEIARLADAVPGPPDFEMIRSVARADAVERLAEMEAASDAAEAETSTEATTESAGGAPEEDRELVPVMDPAIAATAETTAEVAPAAGGAADAEAAASAETAQAPSSDNAAAETAPADGATVVAADMAATAGEPAAAEEPATTGDAGEESPEPVAAGTAAAPGTSDTNPAARFIRSLTAWGQPSDHGDHDPTP